MKRLVLFAMLLALAFVISGCIANSECKKPFISSGGQCCLDLDDNNVCDEKEGENAEPSTQAAETTKVEEKKETPPAQPQITGETTAEVKTEPEPEVQAPAKETVEETTSPAPAPKNATPISEEDLTEIEKLLATFAQKVTGYKYSYKSNWYYLRGDKLRIKLGDAVPITGVSAGGNYFSLYYYDNVYMNRKDKTAFGYCQGTDPRIGAGQCVSLKIVDISYPLSYAAYKTKLPEEWLFEYLGRTPSEIGPSKYYVSGKRTTKLTFQDEDHETRLYFDEVAGLPIRIELVKGNQLIDSYEYEDLSANTVRDEDVTYRKTSEIPSTEAFYSIYSAR